MSNPNDILIRLTKTEDGTQYETLILLNDESMLPEMEKTAEFLRKCLEIYGRTDAATEYASALEYAENLVKPAAPRIKLLNS